MRILNINKFHHLRGGTERYYFGVAKLLREHGHEVRFFSMAHRTNLPDPFDSGFVSELDYESPLGRLRAPVRVIYSLEARRKIEQAIDAFRPDLALLHNLHYQLTLSILGPLRRRRIPIVWRLHDYQILCPNGLFYTMGHVCEACARGAFYHAFFGLCQRGRRLLSAGATVAGYVNRLWKLETAVDLFLSPSEFLRRKMIEHGLPARKIATIPNFVELPAPAARIDTADRPGAAPLVFSGRLSLGKGAKTLVRAMSHVPEARLILAGEGHERAEVGALVETHAPGRIELAGKLSGDKILRLVEEAAAVIVPSEWYENCPYAVLEALARGKPVIGASIGGIPELIDSGVNGFLFPSGDDRALASAIRRVLASPGEAAQIGEAGRERIRRFYVPETHYNRLIELLGPLVRPPMRSSASSE